MQVGGTMCHMTTSVHVTGLVPAFTVADRVRKAREVAEMSQQELADATGMARSGIARIEGPESRPRRTSLIAIAMATGVDLTWLQTGETPAGSDPDGGGVVRHQGLEPRTRWFGALGHLRAA